MRDARPRPVVASDHDEDVLAWRNLAAGMTPELQPLGLRHRNEALRLSCGGKRLERYPGVCIHQSVDRMVVGGTLPESGYTRDVDVRIGYQPDRNPDAA